LLGSYGPLFTSARARRLVATSLSARLAVGMLGLPMILTVRDATGSYAAAGLVSGAWSVGVAVSSPLRGRLVNRRGSRHALPPLALVSAGALAAIPLVGETGSVWALAPVAALSGLAIPPFVASMRVEWQALLGEGHPRLTQAYAFESSVQVAMFVIGPLVAAAGVALAGSAATLAASAALMLAGGLAFASRPRLNPAPTARRARRRSGSRVCSRSCSRRSSRTQRSAWPT
jgi:MFS family permease